MASNTTNRHANLICLLTILVSACMPGEAPAASRLNVVIILTDD
jgi:hypothetical protein